MKKSIHNPKNNLYFHFLEEEFCILRADMEQLWEEMVLVAQNANKTTVQNSIAVNEKTENKIDYANAENGKNDENNNENDERLPYWAELWPSSLALAKWLYENTQEIKEKNCLDLGCGLGFTAICGAWRGAHVLGVDYEERAIMLAKENALANERLLKKNRSLASHNLDFQVMDWRTPHLAPKSFDFIWAADIIYEHSFALPVLTFLDYALSEKGKVWIAEPGRTIFETFKNLISDFSSHFSMQKVSFEKTHSLSAQVPSANVSIWELTRL